MHIHLTNLPYLLCPLNCCCKACACCIEIHKRLHQFDTGRATYDATSKIPCGSGLFVPKMAMCQSSPILEIFPHFDTFCRSAMNNEIPKWWFKQQGKAEFGSVFFFPVLGLQEWATCACAFTLVLAVGRWLSSRCGSQEPTINLSDLMMWKPWKPSGVSVIARWFFWGKKLYRRPTLW